MDVGTTLAPAPTKHEPHINGATKILKKEAHSTSGPVCQRSRGRRANRRSADGELVIPNLGEPARH